MPGFGYTPFGGSPFGEWWWSRYVFYDLLPAIYRDGDTSGFLEKFAESLRPSFDQLRRKARDFGEIRDPLLVRTAVSEQQTLRLGKQVVLRGGVEQSGVDGKVAVLGEFSASTARFTDLDRGKELTIKRSNLPANNRVVTITSVVDRTTVTVSPRLALDAGLLRWDVRQVFSDRPNQTTVEIRGGGADLGKVDLGWTVNDGLASYLVRDRRVFTVDVDERTLLTEREGVKNGNVDSQGRFQTPTYQFSSYDVGKILFISGSNLPTNNGRFEIVGVDKVGATDFRAVFSRLDVLGTAPLSTGVFDSTGTLRYANKADKIARISHVRTGLNTVLSVSVSGDDITVTLATDGFGNATSTALAVAAAVTADVFASVLVTVVPSGPGTGIAGTTDGLRDIPGSVLAPDAQLSWAFAPYGWLVLEGPVPTGMTTSEGVDGFVQPFTASEGLLKSTASALFRSSDVGHIIIIRGSLAGNDGTYEVKSVPSYGAGTLLTIAGTFGTEPVGHTVNWELRTPNSNSGKVEAVASAPSMIVSLAKDFGIEIDTQESEVRQRSWVKHVNQWIDKKGLAKAYEILAAISGYTGVVSQLFNITYSISTELPFDSVYEISDVFGEDATLSDAVGLEVTMTTPTQGLFTTSALHKYLRIQDAALVSNDQLFEVVGFISSTSLRLRSLTAINPAAPDANNGMIRWSLLRLYTSLPPLRPNFDDFDSDAMNALIPSFFVDSYCWEQPIIIGVPVQLKYTGQLGPFAVGEIVTGSTSFATATIEVDSQNGTAGTLSLSNVLGVFISGEPLLGNLLGSAFADGTQSVGGPGALSVVATAEQTESSFVWIDGDIAVVLQLGVWALTSRSGQVFFLETKPLAVKSLTVGAGNSQVTYFQFDPTYTTGIRVAQTNPILLDYAGQLGPFVPLEVITGQTSLVTATVVSNANNGTTGTLTVSLPSGAFIPGEQLLGSFVGDAVAVGTQYGPALTTVSILNGITTDVTVTLRGTPSGVVLATAQEVVTAVFNSLLTGGLLLASAYPGDGTGLAIPGVMTALASNGVFRSAVGTTAPLTFGPASLEYLCEPDLSCDYCGSYRILLGLELDTLFDDNAIAFERIFERTLSRLEDVTPAHAELIARVIQPLVATLSLSATIEPVSTLAVLFAPLSFFFDEVPPDGPSPVPPPPYPPAFTTLTGTAVFTNGSPIVTGTGTLFTTELASYSWVRRSVDTNARVRVLAVIDNLNLVLLSPYQGTTGGGPIVTSNDPFEGDPDYEVDSNPSATITTTILP